MPRDSPISQCGLGSKSNFLGSPQVLTVLFSASETADGDFVAGEVGHAGERLAQLLVESGRRPVEFVEFILQRAGLVHDGCSFVIFAGFFERAHLLRQLVAARLELLRLSDGLAAALVERAKVAQQRGGVGSPRAELLFHQFQVGANKS